MHPHSHAYYRNRNVQRISEKILNRNQSQASLTDGPQDVLSDAVLSAALLGDLSLPLTGDESEAGPEAVQLSMGLGKLTAVCQVVFQSV